VPGSFDGFRQPALMFSTAAGFFSGSDFTQAGNVALKQRRIFEINLLNIFFTEKAISHN